MNVELLCPVLEGVFELFRDRIQHDFRKHQELNQFTALYISREKYLSLVNINGIDHVEINVDVEKFSKDQTKEIRLEFRVQPFIQSTRSCNRCSHLEGLVGCGVGKKHN